MASVCGQSASVLYRQVLRHSAQMLLVREKNSDRRRGLVDMGTDRSRSTLPLQGRLSFDEGLVRSYDCP